MINSESNNFGIDPALVKNDLYAKLAIKRFQTLAIYNNTKEFILEKKHMNVKLAINGLPNHKASKNMRKYIQEKNQTSVKLARRLLEA